MPPPCSPRPARLDRTPAALDHAAAAFAGKDAVLRSSTHPRPPATSSAAEQEADLVERLAQRFDLPAVASCAAAAAALRAKRIEKVQLVHPPWFTEDFDDLGEAYFRSHGFDAVVTKAVALPENPADVAPRAVVDWVEHHVHDRVEAIFLAGTGFAAAGAIEDLEVRTGRLVIEANQALLWAILTATGTNWDLGAYGRLLRINANQQWSLWPAQTGLSRTLDTTEKDAP